MYSIIWPTILPKQAPTAREGIKIPALLQNRQRKAIFADFKRHEPGTLMPKVMIVKQPLMIRAMKTSQITVASSWGWLTQRLLEEDELHSSNNFEDSQSGLSLI